jgi:hypothetical protein
MILGGLLGGFAMWLVGFIFWGTPLNMLALSNAGDIESAAVQAALAQQLGPGGTGAYPIPWPGTPAGTAAYGQGPIALVLFNANGFANPDMGALVGGLILSIVCALLLAFALRMAVSNATFGVRMRLVAVLAVAFTAYSQLGQPIFNHAPTGYFVYLWISEVIGWLAAGAVIAKLLPGPASAARPAS